VNQGKTHTYVKEPSVGVPTSCGQIVEKKKTTNGIIDLFIAHVCRLSIGEERRGEQMGTVALRKINHQDSKSFQELSRYLFCDARARVMLLLLG
jgi:hypothetical protein